MIEQITVNASNESLFSADFIKGFRCGANRQFQSDVEKIAKAKVLTEWIPVSERLPKNERKRYWVCTDSGYQCECRWTNNRFGLRECGEWGWSIFDTPQYSKVVAWMPLPKPYREDSEA